MTGWEVLNNMLLRYGAIIVIAFIIAGQSPDNTSTSHWSVEVRKTTLDSTDYYHIIAYGITSNLAYHCQGIGSTTAGYTNWASM